MLVGRTRGGDWILHVRGSGRLAAAGANDRARTAARARESRPGDVGDLEALDLRAGDLVPERLTARLSLLGATPTATFTFARDHADTEQAIDDAGIDFTFLRNNLYADLAPYLGGEAGVIRGPAGSGRLSPVARADVADVAAAIIRDPAAHVRATYQLTGPEAMTMSELAARTAEVVGRSIRFVDESLEDAYRWRRAEHDAEPWEIDGWVTTYLAVADGSVAQVTHDVQRILNRPARTLEQTLAH